MEVFIVHLETGEYEDRQSKIVGVFSSEYKANEYVDEKIRQLDKLGLHARGNDSNCHDYELRYSDEVQRQFGHIVYTGAWYNISGPYTVQ